MVKATLGQEHRVCQLVLLFIVLLFICASIIDMSEEDVTILSRACQFGSTRN
jgi:hypothetical protein